MEKENQFFTELKFKGNKSAVPTTENKQISTKFSSNYDIKTEDQDLEEAPSMSYHEDCKSEVPYEVNLKSEWYGNELKFEMDPDNIKQEPGDYCIDSKKAVQDIKIELPEIDGIDNYVGEQDIKNEEFILKDEEEDSDVTKCIKSETHTLKTTKNDNQCMKASSQLTKKIHQCPKCNYRSVRASYLQRHIIKHKALTTDVEKFNCEHCVYFSCDKLSLTRHLLIHSNKKRHVCTICSKTFSQKIRIDHHILNHHSDNQPLMATITNKIRECQKCSYKCLSKLHLNRHLLKHKEIQTELRKFTCKYCEYSTYNKWHLNDHLFVHSDSKPHVCEICNKRFIRKRQIDSHIFSQHSDNQQLMATIAQKIHECQHCSYKSLCSVRLKQHLLKHKEIHSDLQKLQCEHCGYCTYLKTNFNRHLLVHTNRKPHICSICNKGFIQKKELDAHIVTNHSNNTKLMATVTKKIYDCQKCYYKTTFNVTFKKHLKTHE